MLLMGAKGIEPSSCKRFPVKTLGLSQTFSTSKAEWEDSVARMARHCLPQTL